jgi:hypothetical protein
MALHMGRMRTRDREQPRLVDELGHRQVVEPTTERRVRELTTGWRNVNGTSLPTTEATWRRR